MGQGFTDQPRRLKPLREPRARFQTISKPTAMACMPCSVHPHQTDACARVWVFLFLFLPSALLGEAFKMTNKGYRLRCACAMKGDLQSGRNYARRRARACGPNSTSTLDGRRSHRKCGTRPPSRNSPGPLSCGCRSWNELCQATIRWGIARRSAPRTKCKAVPQSLAPRTPSRRSRQRQPRAEARAARHALANLVQAWVGLARGAR